MVRELTVYREPAPGSVVVYLRDNCDRDQLLDLGVQLGAEVVDADSDHPQKEVPLANITTHLTNEAQGPARLVHIPFYRLLDAFAAAPKDLLVLLYCENGLMSRIQAAHLRRAGFDNVGMLMPDATP